jgi:hypothetical protein
MPVTPIGQLRKHYGPGIWDELPAEQKKDVIALVHVGGPSYALPEMLSLPSPTQLHGRQRQCVGQQLQAQLPQSNEARACSDLCVSASLWLAVSKLSVSGCCQWCRQKQTPT